MEHRVLGAVALLLASATGCGDTATGPGASGSLVGTAAAEPAEVAVAYGATVRVPALGLDIGFAELVEESRCPTHAFILCAWEGNAAVDLALSLHGEPPIVTRLNTALEPKTVVHGSVRVTLVEVLPVPYDVGPISVETYSLRLLVRSAVGKAGS
jgi:hypothetical protein